MTVHAWPHTVTTNTPQRRRTHDTCGRHKPAGGGGGGGGVGAQQLFEQLLQPSPVRHVRAVPHQPAQRAVLHPVAAAREVQCLRRAAPARVLGGEAEAQRVVARIGARGGDAARSAALEAALGVREQRGGALRLLAVWALHRAEEARVEEVLLAALQRERRRRAAERLVRAAHEPAAQQAVGYGVEGRLLLCRQLCAGATRLRSLGRERGVRVAADYCPAVDGARALRAAKLEP